MPCHTGNVPLRVWILWKKNLLVEQLHIQIRLDLPEEFRLGKPECRVGCVCAPSYREKRKLGNNTVFLTKQPECLHQPRYIYFPSVRILHIFSMRTWLWFSFPCWIQFSCDVHRKSSGRSRVRWWRRWRQRRTPSTSFNSTQSPLR